jgi:hypothetical protein
MADYIGAAGGYLVDSAATQDCQYCQLQSTDTFLASFGMYYSHAWRNFGILIAYCVFNVFAAMALYYLVRVVSWRVVCLVSYHSSWLTVSVASHPQPKKAKAQKASSEKKGESDKKA